MKELSYFPILIEWSDTKTREVVIHPEFISNGRAFKVIETNTKQKQDSN